MDLVAHLRYFVAVAEHRHFGRAAASLGVTQPPVSQGLRRLEKHLGLQLIERTSEGAVVTTHGAALLPRARLIVDDSARFLDDARHMFGSVQGVRWGVVPQLDDELVARCVAGIRSTLESDDVGVTTVTAGTSQLLSELRRGAIQLAVVQHPVLVDGLDAGPVVSVARSVVLPAGHRAAEAAAPRAQMLQDLELATVPREDNPPAHDLLIDQLRRRGLDPSTRPASTHRDVAAAAASGSCFGLATGGGPVHTGTTHRRMLVDEVALRLRIVTAPGVDLADATYAVDRQLLRADR
ncbi:LysR family transcriptional regulator [Mycolicibacterium litorale]|uniref:LysR family transcriptional regulator n=1 Tax=Mycolicibacterium litorale TaxID=758802 RepID=UPI001064F245|nr:LysR family transcriptional regulator [Mycolicibacterium litorale]MCV7417437.1 LysR family transcriptional regulator [Mycolicibacterium litorale]